MPPSTVSPFAENALQLAEMGLAVIPCPGDDGKSPRGAVRGFDKWKRPLRADALGRMMSRFPAANIGIVTSASAVTVVDVDGDDDLAKEMLERCGNTPLITRTPSGVIHRRRDVQAWLDARRVEVG